MTLPVPAVLLVFFNRPDLAKQTLSRVREARPSQVFIAVDGARSDRPEEADLCRQCQELVTEIDWKCDIHTLFRDENLGCRSAVSGAISWFFEHVDEGIILEDDCVPDSSFFPFCGELLERYRHDTRIMCISGDNPLDGRWMPQTSYYLTVVPFIWGWATWKRAWAHFENYEYAPVDNSWIRQLLTTEEAADYWERNINRTLNNQINAWGPRWLYSCLQNHGLTVVASRNLISNVGFDQRAAHTRNPKHWESARLTSSLDFPLKHPARICRDFEADNLIARVKFSIRPRKRTCENIGTRIDLHLVKIAGFAGRLKSQLARLHPRRVLRKCFRMLSRNTSS